MRKREIVLAALAASLLTAGTAHATETTSCMDTCANTFGSAIIVASPSGGSVQSLSGCETSYYYAYIGGGMVEQTAVTTCTYS